MESPDPRYHAMKSYSILPVPDMDLSNLPGHFQHLLSAVVAVNGFLHVVLRCHDEKLPLDEYSPSITMICDDDWISTGPERFNSDTLDLIFRNAAHVALNASDTNPVNYAPTSYAVGKLGNSVIVECRRATAAAWMKRAKAAKADIRLLYIGPDGEKVAEEAGVEYMPAPNPDQFEALRERVAVKMAEQEAEGKTLN